MPSCDIVKYLVSGHLTLLFIATIFAVVNTLGQKIVTVEFGCYDSSTLVGVGICPCLDANY